MLASHALPITLLLKTAFSIDIGIWENDGYHGGTARYLPPIMYAEKKYQSFGSKHFPPRHYV
jgi:hypothetical protein